MSRSMNKVFIMGHIGNDPELKPAKSGRPFTRLSVATKRRWADADEGVKEVTDWHSVFVWGKLAEQCVNSLQRGSLVFVEGTLSYWSVAQDSAAVYKNAVHGFSVRFLSSPIAADPLPMGLEPSGPNLDNLEEAGNHNAVAHLSS